MGIGCDNVRVCVPPIYSFHCLQSVYSNLGLLVMYGYYHCFEHIHIHTSHNTITHRCAGLADSGCQDVLCRIESVVSSVMQHEKEK